ncbi:hypothetical protein [Natrialba sp. PRR66]|uniref:hypothetical protein n=1 Tax=Natrialba sp. PRR66 TaxID=3098146 RepID=UPI002B1D9291|nr:hypothetical protein [Natrialba sp. PRR66]
MPGKTTVEYIEPGTDLDSHTEGVVLFSTNDKCYGKRVTEIIENIEPKLIGYNDSLVVEPHSDGLNRAIDCSVEDHRSLIANSAWLIDCNSVLDQTSRSDIIYLLRTFPWQGNAIIWADEDCHDLTEEDRDTLETISDKAAVVYSERRLCGKLEDYLQHAANPMFGSGSIIDWNNRVYEIQQALG